MSDAHDHHAEHGHPSGHDPNLAHHFGSMEQQFESGKLGMWVFLATEILMFGGLFCAYAIYRGNHPEVFLFAHKALDTNLGAINTGVLLASSFTMAWAVLAISRGQRAIALVMLALTFCGGIGFMGIKSVEYYSKYQHHLLIGTTNAFYQKDGTFTHPEELQHTTEYIEKKAGHDVKAHGDAHADVIEETLAVDASSIAPSHDVNPAEAALKDVVHADPTHGNPASAATAEGMVKTPTALVWPPRPVDHSTIAPASNAATMPAPGFAQVLPAVAEQPGGDAHAIAHGSHYPRLEELDALNQDRLHLFFQIYFVMTGLHGLHVLIGMGIIAWVFFKTLGGAFSPTYYAPVEITGLYWHLVDLIWIFLFPLLYLIH